MEEKKLFRRISSGSVFAGICTGLAEYTDVDVTFWRLLFVLGTIFSVFPFVLSYFIMWIVVPKTN